MNLPKELTTVTCTSRILALIMFSLLPVIGFFLGTDYQKSADLKDTVNSMNIRDTNKNITPKYNNGTLGYGRSVRNMLASPTASPTFTPYPTAVIPYSIASWKTFTDDIDGFALRYAADWATWRNPYTSQQYVQSGIKEILSAYSSDLNGGGAGGQTGLNIALLNNPGSLSLQEFVKQDPYDMFRYQSFVKNPNSFGINTPWIIDRNAPTAGDLAEEVLIEKGNNIIDISFDGLPDNVVDQILSTFKFTK